MVLSKRRVSFWIREQWDTNFILVLTINDSVDRMTTLTIHYPPSPLKFPGAELMHTRVEVGAEEDGLVGQEPLSLFYSSK